MPFYLRGPHKHAFIDTGSRGIESRLERPGLGLKDRHKTRNRLLQDLQAAGLKCKKKPEPNSRN